MSSRQVFGYFASTDRTMPEATLRKIYSARWAIEVLFRNLKQNLSFGTLLCGDKNASDFAVCMLFALVVSLRLKPKIWQNEAGHTIGEMIAVIKEKSLHRHIELLGFQSSKDLRSRVGLKEISLGLVESPSTGLRPSQRTLRYRYESSPVLRQHQIRGRICQ